MAVINRKYDFGAIVPWRLIVSKYLEIDDHFGRVMYWAAPCPRNHQAGAQLQKGLGNSKPFCLAKHSEDPPEGSLAMARMPAHGGRARWEEMASAGPRPGRRGRQANLLPPWPDVLRSRLVV